MKESYQILTASPRHIILLTSSSFSVLAYEILLIRLMSICWWHHFASMVISIALLGFGAAGSILFLFQNRIMKNLDKWLISLGGATAVSFPICFSLSQKIGLDPLQLVWQPIQWIKMLVTYVIMSIPFLLAGSIIGTILTGSGRYIHRMYAVDLFAAGCGALCVIPSLYIDLPWNLLMVLGFVMILGSVWSCISSKKHLLAGALTLFVSAGLMIISFIVIPPIPVIHDTKSLPMTLAFPDARIEIERTGPLGLVHVVRSSMIRYAPGLSLMYGLSSESQGRLFPEQKAIFSDGDGLSPVVSFGDDLNSLQYLDYTSMALPYNIRHQDRVLVVGAGGGSDILTGLIHFSSKIIALEANQQIADIMLGPEARFSGDLYKRPEVSLIVKDAREYVHSTKELFDLIQISMMDSYSNSAGGVYSARENYLLTVEAFEEYLRHLKDTGMLVVSQWLRLPPRNSLRIFTTALTALRKTETNEAPEGRLILIRSWKTFTLVISKKQFTQDEILKAKRFCQERCFDLVYYPGMRMEEANIYDVLDSPIYYNFVKKLLGTDAESFIDEYVFDISASTDDRPFFSHFFRWKKAPELYLSLKRELFPMVEMGYVFILAALVQVIFAGLMLILLPLIFIRQIEDRSQTVDERATLFDIFGLILYFVCIGAGFMFLEIAFLSKYTLILSHPVYSAGVVLATVLIFAGGGSLLVKRSGSLTNGFLWIPVLVVLCWILIHWVGGDRMVGAALTWPFAKKLGFSVLWLSVPAFFMGWPFPAGLGVVSDNYPGLVPWAWGINGCASVSGAVLAKCLAVSIGFKFLMLSAAVLYISGVSAFYIILVKSRKINNSHFD